MSRQKGFGALGIAIAMMFVGFIGLIGWVVYQQQSKQDNKVADIATSSKPGVVNTWTGKGGDYKWSNAANWSEGALASEEDVVINVADVEQRVGDDGKSFREVPFEQDVAGLDLHQLTIKGKVASIQISIKGKPLTVTAGLDFDVTASALEAVPQLTFYNDITLKGDQTVFAGERNYLAFVSPRPVNIFEHTLKLRVSDNGGLVFESPLKGTGAIAVPVNSIGQNANVLFRTPSPDYSGPVSIASGNRIGMMNEPAEGAARTLDNVYGLGTGTITIRDGGTLTIYAEGSGPREVPNNFIMGGNGIFSSTKNTGLYAGALNVCLADGKSACGGGGRIRLSGKVSLTSDTQVGAVFGGEAQQTPTSTTVTYVIPALNANSYTLTPVAGSLTAIEK